MGGGGPGFLGPRAVGHGATRCGEEAGVLVAPADRDDPIRRHLQAIPQHGQRIAATDPVAEAATLGRHLGVKPHLAGRALVAKAQHVRQTKVSKHPTPDHLGRDEEPVAQNADPKSESSELNHRLDRPRRQRLSSRGLEKGLPTHSPEQSGQGLNPIRGLGTGLGQAASQGARASGLTGQVFEEAGLGEHAIDVAEHQAAGRILGGSHPVDSHPVDFRSGGALPLDRFSHLRAP